MSVSMIEEMAEILAEHADYINDDDSSGILCAGCFGRLVPDGDSHAGSLAGLAAHQAEVLAANGYGSVRETSERVGRKYAELYQLLRDDLQDQAWVEGYGQGYSDCVWSKGHEPALRSPYRRQK